MNNKEKFELYKQGKLSGLDIDEWTEEIKWFAIKNNKPLYFDVSTLSNNMVIKGLKEGYTKLFNLDIIETHDIPDDVYIDFIRKVPDDSEFFSPFEAEKYCKCEKLQKHDIMYELALRYPMYVYYARQNNIQFTNEEYYKIADIYFEEDELDRPFNWGDMPLDDKHWKMIVNDEISLTSDEHETFIKREDCPKYVYYDFLAESSKYDIEKLPSISGEDLYFYLQTKRNESSYEFEDCCKYLLTQKHCNCTDLDTLLKKDGSYIQYMRNPKINLCKAAIDNSPDNIKYIDVKSENVYLYALKKDKYENVAKYIDEKHLTPKIRDYLGIKEEVKSKYPADYYVVKFECNLADEGNLQKVACIKGSEMEDYLNKEFSVSFGNLEDNEIRVVKDYVSYEPIPKEMYNMLKKLGLDNIESGYFNMDYDLEYDKDNSEYELY